MNPPKVMFAMKRCRLSPLKVSLLTRLQMLRLLGVSGGAAFMSTIVKVPTTFSSPMQPLPVGKGLPRVPVQVREHRLNEKGPT